VGRIYPDRSHKKSFLAGDALAALLPDKLNKFFFTNSGSESVDTAIKIALAYHRARRESSRAIFVSRERSYHGVNLGGVALSGLVNNRRAFGVSAVPVVHMRHTWLDSNKFTPGQPIHGAELAEDLLRLVELHGAENIAACFVEPIAGSTGALVPPVGYLERLREICTAHKILLVFDEVICGFGRTGQPFAAQSFGVSPDMITMAKAITNGNIPMGAVAVHEDIHDTIMNAAPEHNIEFFHGYTWSGNPVACAASLATLDIYKSENLFERASSLSQYFLEKVFSLDDVGGVIDIRGYGTLAGVDIDPNIIGMSGYELQKKLFDRGLHIKTTGNAALLSPPFISSKENLDFMVQTLRDTLTHRQS
jgi:beta-alanine--pyruvate transaminase